MDKDPPADTLSTTRSRFWLLGILLVTGSCLLAVIHLSHGLHVQLVANRKIVSALREQVLAEAEERDMLLREKDSSSSKTALLRSKAKLVTEELLDQHRKSKHLQNELLLAREDIQALSKNCTIATQRLRYRYDVTLRALHDRIIQEQEYRALLQRDVAERAKIETTLAFMQDRDYNLSAQLRTIKAKLRDVLVLAKSTRDENARLQGQLRALQQSSASAATAIATTASPQQKTPSIWKTSMDKESGRPFYFNTVTRKSQWEKPSDLV